MLMNCVTVFRAHRQVDCDDGVAAIDGLSCASINSLHKYRSIKESVACVFTNGWEKGDMVRGGNSQF